MKEPDDKVSIWENALIENIIRRNACRHALKKGLFMDLLDFIKLDFDHGYPTSNISIVTKIYEQS